MNFQSINLLYDIIMLNTFSHVQSKTTIIDSKLNRKFCPKFLIFREFRTLEEIVPVSANMKLRISSNE